MTTEFNNYLIELFCVFAHAVVLYITHQVTNIKRSNYRLNDDVRFLSLIISFLCLNFAIYPTTIAHIKNLDNMIWGFMLEFLGLTLFQYIIICDQINHHQHQIDLLAKQYTDDKINYMIDSYTEYYEILEEALVGQNEELKNNTLKFIDTSFDTLLGRVERRMEDIADGIKERPFRTRRNSF
jgi:hypothetical protein